MVNGETTAKPVPMWPGMSTPLPGNAAGDSNHTGTFLGTQMVVGPWSLPEDPSTGDLSLAVRATSHYFALISVLTCGV